MDQSEQRPGRREGLPTSRGRGWLTSIALVGAGLLAAAVVADTLTAEGAGGGGSSSVLAVPAAATSTGSPSDPDDRGHDWWNWWHGDDEAQVSDDVAAEVEDAVLAEYPGATIWRVRSDSGGGYDAYLETADGEDLVVHLDAAFAVTGAEDLPDADGHDGAGHGWAGPGWGGRCGDDSAAPVPGAAAEVEDAVLAQYPGATIWRVRSDSGGGYDAYLETADGKDLVVHLDGAFAVTGTDDLPGHDGWWGPARASVSDETAAAVEDAVLAQHPGATVLWIWADTDDGGHGALVRTADGGRVVVHLDDSFAITETEDVPGC